MNNLNIHKFRPIHLIVALFLFVSNILLAENIKKMPSIIPMSWMKSNINNPNLVILDLRTKEDYNKGHIQSAINIPALKSLFEEKTLMMPKLDFLKELFSKAGIDNNSLVVSYDNGDFALAARLYWILEVLGHQNVGLLEYGYGKYIQLNLPISTETTVVQKKDFIPRVSDEQIQTKLSTLMAIGNKTIIDGRASTHYQGKESLSTRFGHIPTAQNYACTNNFQISTDGNRMKNIEELAEVYKDIPKDKEIILYCQGGAQAALNYIVLTKLGYKASVYDGSWKEWGNDPAVPVENPNQQ